MATLHNREEELGGIILRKKHKGITFLNDTELNTCVVPTYSMNLQ